MATTAKTTGQPLVVAAVPLDNVTARTELRGISEVARRLGWNLETIDSSLTGDGYGQYRAVLARADGVIVRLMESLVDVLDLTGDVPIVGLDIRRTSVSRSDKTLYAKRECVKALWASVLCDHAKVAAAAADELIATGRKCFAFVPMLRRYQWTGPRGKFFLERIRAAGCDARLYKPVTEWAWVKERENLARFLAALPRPFGVFAGNDLLAKFALEACRTAGLAVPDDAAIIGADDDETFCLSSSPPLSSVRIDFEGAGRLAAEALASLLGGARPARTRMVGYGTMGVARRDSTRGAGGGLDLRVAAGLDFIATHSGDPFVGVRDVAAAMGVGRRQADRLFAVTGKSIRRHMEETRLAAAQAMLRGRGDAISDIAAYCGFSSANYFIRIFRARFGASPARWRQALS